MHLVEIYKNKLVGCSDFCPLLFHLYGGQMLPFRNSKPVSCHGYISASTTGSDGYFRNSRKLFKDP